MPNQTTILSAIAADREDNYREGDPSEGVRAEFASEPTGGQLEFRHTAGIGRASLTLGGGVARTEADQRLQLTSEIFALGPPIENQEVTRVRDIYGIASLPLGKQLDLSLRFGRDIVELEETESKAWTPGIGLIWAPLPGVDVRLAAARTVQKPSVTDQSIRPTELTGLNLVYDEFEGTRSDAVGGQATWQIVDRLRVGASLTRRWMARELLTGSDPDVERKIDDQREDLASVFAYTTMTNRIAISLEPTYESYRRKERDTPEGPLRVKSWLLPVSVHWFNPNGLFAVVTSTPVFQELDRRTEEGDIEQLDSAGLLLDLAVGYRIPERRGLFALEVNNLLDEDLNFQDESFRARQPEEVGVAVSQRRFLPSRSIIARLTLTF